MEMKKCLFINNYDGDNEHFPKHHLWGLDALREKFYVKLFIFQSIPFRKYRILIVQLRVLFKSLFVDVVYTACSIAGVLQKKDSKLLKNCVVQIIKDIKII